jgi:rare lipoprotein A
MFRQLKHQRLAGVLMTVLLFAGCAASDYCTMPSSRYRERGLAYWYEGKKTSSGEPYDPHAMTAAHRTLPLPTYVKVTNLLNKRSVIVKVNDREPFRDDGRIIDLSYAAAASLDILGHGEDPVEVRTIDVCGDFKDSDTNNRVEIGDKPLRRESVVSLAAGQETLETHAPGLPKAKPAPKELREPKAMPVSPLAKTTKPTEIAPVTSPAVTAPQPAATLTRQSATDTVEQRPAAAGKKIKHVFLQVGAFLIQDNAVRLQWHIEQQVARKVTIIEQPSTDGTFYKVQVGPLDSRAEADRISRELKPLGINKSLPVVR